MQSWKRAGMGLDQLVAEYVNQGKSLSQICFDYDISPGVSGLGEMSAVLRRAGYSIRNGWGESNRKRKITKDSMEKRWGISWDELVEWYMERKPLSALCAKHGLSPIGKTTVLNRMLADEGILTDDPLRGFGFGEKELLCMYVDEGMSMLAIRRKFNLSRGATTTVSHVLRELGVHRGGYAKNTNNKKQFSSDGYVRLPVTQANKHLTNIRSSGTEMEHRLVVAASIGRPLERNEWVHHINRDTADNRLSNLLLVDRDIHKRIHISMDKVIEELFKEGVVALSEDKEYAIKESDDYTRGFTDGVQSILESE